MNAFGMVAPRRLSMMAFGIATTSALIFRVFAGHGGGVGCCAGAAAGIDAVAGAASAFASDGFASVGFEVFAVVAGIFAGDSDTCVLASTIGLSTVTFGVCARAVVAANKLRPSIVNEATT